MAERRRSLGMAKKPLRLCKVIYEKRVAEIDTATL
jgi:hypothetical protein